MRTSSPRNKAIVPPVAVTWQRLGRFVAFLALAVALTLASSAVRSTRLEVQDWDCPPPPASCARPMLVVGFPLPYISDYHGISVGNHASLSGALLGEDLFHLDAFLANIALYFVLILLVVATLRLVQRGPRAPASMNADAHSP